MAITVGALTHYNRNNGIARCAIKANLRKAYDSLDLNFILMCLLSAGFPTKFVHWIMVCITYSRFSISLNYSLVVYLQGGKGLRLGDPLCPYHFVILSRLVQSRVQVFNNFKFHPHCKEVGLTHLSFADDLPMFSAADLPELNLLKDALLDFGKILAVNPSKSEAFCASILATLKLIF